MSVCVNASKMLNNNIPIAHPSLISPIEVSVEKIDNAYIITYPHLCIYGKGPTLEDAIDNLIEHMDTLYQCYVEDTFSKLSDDAISFKNDLIKVFRPLR